VGSDLWSGSEGGGGCLGGRRLGWGGGDGGGEGGVEVSPLGRWTRFGLGSGGTIYRIPAAPAQSLEIDEGGSHL